MPLGPTVGVAAVMRACLVLRGDVELPGAHLPPPRDDPRRAVRARGGRGGCAGGGGGGARQVKVKFTGLTQTLGQL